MICAAHGTRRTPRAESACEFSAKLIVATISDLSNNNINIHNTPSTIKRYKQLPNVILYCELITVNVTQHQLLIAREEADSLSQQLITMYCNMWRRGLKSVLSRFFYILSAIYP